MKYLFQPMVFLVLFGLCILVNCVRQEEEINLEKIMEQAEMELNEELKRSMMDGATSRGFPRKKFTAFTRAMSKRNALHSKAARMLKALGLSSKEASNLVANRQGNRSKNKGPGGLSGKTPDVVLVDDLCDNVEPDCDKNQNYRTISGQCNNLDNPYWGSMTIPMRRYLPTIKDLHLIPTYDALLTDRTDNKDVASGQQNRQYSSGSYDDFGLSGENCRCDSGCVKDAEASLPLPRLVSHAFHTDIDVPDNIATHMVTQWGQFLDHDITLTPEEHVEDCCDATTDDSGNICYGECTEGEENACLPILVPATDSFYSTVGVTCQEFTRSTPFCNTAEEGDREQINGITAFVDASNVYGSDDETAATLRSFEDGMLKVDDTYPDYPTLPLEDTDGEELEVAGDVRAREMPGLAAMHTLWVREHNRIAGLLKPHLEKKGKSDSSDEDLYQEARRIVIAEMQNVVYGEYLPVVVGDDDDIKLKTDSNYDDDTDPSISNSFATAAYRFGHSMIQGGIQMWGFTGTGRDALPTYSSEYLLRNNYFNMTNYYADGYTGLESIINGLVSQPAQTCDQFITQEVSNFLIPEEGSASDFGGDLVARNIQRGRDHGLPGFAAFYKNKDYGADEPSNALDCWDKKPDTISQEKWDLLKTIYKHPYHIDLFVGGLAEEPYKDGLTGSVFQKIKIKQFQALMEGDRFFFTHRNAPGGFREKAQEHIMSRTLADIICDNTKLEKVPQNVFKQHDSDSNQYKTCSTSVFDLDLDEINTLYEDERK